MTADTPATVFVNLYRPLMGCCGSVYTSRELAEQMAGRDRLACVEVKIGESLAATLLAKVGNS